MAQQAAEVKDELRGQSSSPSPVRNRGPSPLRHEHGKPAGYYLQRNPPAAPFDFHQWAEGAGVSHDYGDPNATSPSNAWEAERLASMRAQDAQSKEFVNSFPRSVIKADSHIRRNEEIRFETERKTQLLRDNFAFCQALRAEVGDRPRFRPGQVVLHYWAKWFDSGTVPGQLTKSNRPRYYTSKVISSRDKGEVQYAGGTSSAYSYVIH